MLCLERSRYSLLVMCSNVFAFLSQVYEIASLVERVEYRSEEHDGTIEKVHFARTRTFHEVGWFGRTTRSVNTVTSIQTIHRANPVM